MTARREAARPHPLLWIVPVLAAAALYLPAVRHDFVNWDDGPYVYHNTRLSDGSWRALASHFVERDPAGGWRLPTVMGNYHPLTMVSLHLDRRLSTTDPSPDPARETDLRANVFHATNVALHVANTLLVFAVALRLRRLAQARPVPAAPLDPGRTAFVAALLFALATLHVESVAWVAERKDVLYAFFFFLSLTAWLEYVRAGSRRWYLAALGAFALSLLSKGQAVTLPLVLVAVDAVLGRPLRGRGLLEKAPFVGLALAFGLLAVHTQSGNVLVGEAAQQPWWLRPFFAAYGLAHYVLRLFVPVGLQVHYTYAQALSRPLLLYVVCPLAVAVGALATVRVWRRERVAGFGLLFFFLTLLPVLQLVPVGHAVMADRYTYVASAGVFLAAAAASGHLLTRPGRTRAVAGALALYALATGVVTAMRVAVWRNSETLWAADVRRDPRSTRAHNNLGIALRNRGAHADAERHFRAAVAIDAANHEAWNNLGTALDTLGRSREAVGAFERALDGDPAFAVARANLAGALHRSGESERAVELFRETLRVQPRYHVARGGLIDALRQRGRLEEAEAECRAGLALEPQSFRYAQELGRVLGDRGVAARRAGRMGEAEDLFRRALEADAANPVTHANLGALLAAQGREVEAAAHLREAVGLAPGEPEHVRALAWLLATARDAQPVVPDEARRVAARAVEMTRGGDALSLYALGLAEAAAGRAGPAQAALRRAVAAARAAGHSDLAGEIQSRLAASER